MTNKIMFEGMTYIPESKFEQKFAIDDGIGGTGSFKLKADGCFMRHDKTREEMKLTENESAIRDFRVNNREEYRESLIQIMAKDLISKGISPRKRDKALECFIIRNSSMLSDDNIRNIDRI